MFIDNALAIRLLGAVHDIAVAAAAPGYSSAPTQCA